MNTKGRVIFANYSVPPIRPLLLFMFSSIIYISYHTEKDNWFFFIITIHKYSIR